MFGLTVKKKIEFIKTLNSDESASILRQLIECQPNLVNAIYDIAVKTACDIDSDGIMDDVFYELNALDVDDLFSRSGKTRYGYKEPSEEAWEMFEEALQPHIDDMNKGHKRGLVAVSKVHCIGIIKGLVKYENESYSEFKDWAVDAPFEYIDRIIDEWKKANPDESDIAEVILIADNLRSGNSDIKLSIT